MPLIDAAAGPLARLIDTLISDPQARDRATLALLRADRQELEAIELQLRAIVAEAESADPWASRARPSFLYVMYAMLLWSIPMGLIAAAAPEMAERIARGTTAYLRGLPEELYALFGTGYLGYTAMRQWGKVKGVER